MATFTSFEDIEAWRSARELTREVYRVTRSPPLRADAGLASHLQRASVSVMSNIAEGFERGSERDFARFLRIARGSASGVRSQLHVALDVGYVSREVFDDLNGRAKRVTAMLNGLIRYLQRCTS
ncbi:MAG: four helix bundle protein [Bacteroidota bacterium]